MSQHFEPEPVSLNLSSSSMVAAHTGRWLMAESTSAYQNKTVHLRKPSSFTAAEGAAGPASENTSTNRLPALAGAAPMGAAERIPRRSADGDGVDWKTKDSCSRDTQM